MNKITLFFVSVCIISAFTAPVDTFGHQLKTGGTKSLDLQECTRGEPQRTLTKGTFIQKSRYTASEQLQISRDISLTIEHFGCEHYAEHYKFLVASDSHDETDWKYWLEKAAGLLGRLPVTDASRMTIKDMQKSFTKLAESKQPYVYGDPIFFSEMEYVEFRVIRHGPESLYIEILYQVTL